MQHIDAGPFALVTAEWLDHDRKAKFINRFFQLVRIRYNGPFRYGNTGFFQDQLSGIFVAGILHGKAGGIAGHGGLDVLLMDAIPQLDQAAALVVDVGDIAADGL